DRATGADHRVVGGGQAGGVRRGRRPRPLTLECPAGRSPEGGRPVFCAVAGVGALIPAPWRVPVAGFRMALRIAPETRRAPCHGLYRTRDGTGAMPRPVSHAKLD